MPRVGLSILCFLSAICAAHAAKCFTQCTSVNPPLPAGCVLKPIFEPETILTVFKGGWDSIDLAGTAFKILAQELLGYKNMAHKNGPWGDKTTACCHGGIGDCTMDTSKYKADTLAGDGHGYQCYWKDAKGAKHYHDFMAEIWPNGFEAGIAEQVFDKKTVVALGAIGYFGRNGIYATGAQAPTYYKQAFDFWKSYLQRSVIEELPKRSETEPAVVAGKTKDGKWLCDTATYPWCKNGRFTPPHCKTAADCADVMLYKPSWMMAQFEQMIMNLKLNLTTINVGPSSWAKEILKASVRNTPQLFYDFQPAKTAATLNTTRVSLPPHVGAQYGASPNRYNEKGPIQSDFPSQMLAKLGSKRMCTLAPDACELGKKMGLTLDNINGMMKLLPSAASGVATTQDLLDKAACKWLRANPNIWEPWKPAVLCPAGKVYAATTHTCNACAANTIAPVRGLTKCTKCPAGKVSSDGIACANPADTVAINTGEIIAIFIGLFVGWLILSGPQSYLLGQLQKDPQYTLDATTLGNDCRTESLLDAMEFSAAALIIVNLKKEVSTLESVQLCLISLAMANILFVDLFTLYHISCPKPKLVYLATFRHIHCALSIFLVVPVLGVEVELYLETLAMTDLICIIVLSVDIGYRLRAAVGFYSGDNKPVSSGATAVPIEAPSNSTGNGHAVDKTAEANPVEIAGCADQQDAGGAFGTCCAARTNQ